MNRPRILTPLATLALGCALAGPSPAAANALARDRDPVVLTGADLPDLLGSPPARLVAFRWQAGWVPIPVQVDERANVDFGAIYDTTATGFTVLAYTDTSTFTGPDPDPLFDADDELALRARDAGDARATALGPAGTLPGSGVELTITDPLGGGRGYAYLFASDGSLDPNAGVAPVAYDFHLLSGGYKATYSIHAGPNPEDSRVTTASYSVHFSDRWIRNEIEVTTGGASGVDILDRHKNLFAPGNCTRSENTFSAGEGAFLVNRTGPVRALRWYVGANSGVTTHRLHVFYEAREDCITTLRVHPIPGVVDYFDYSPAASGMTYRNDLDTTGVTVDGSPDAVPRGAPQWEMVGGPQGTLVMTGRIVTDIAGLPITNYYSDTLSPTTIQCTGDAWEYGASGLWVNGSIPNTDPSLGAAGSFQAVRIIAYDAPDRDLAFARACAAQATIPLAVTAAPYAPAVGVESGPAPLALALSPNPARGSVRLALTLPHEARVRLTVLDVGGRLVAVLADGRLAAGTTSVVWDADRAAPGLYLARAMVDGVAVVVHRLTIAR